MERRILADILNIKPYLDDITVFNDVAFAFYSQTAFIAGFGSTAKMHQILVRNHFRADKPFSISE
jgi:hypothetical protein